MRFRFGPFEADEQRFELRRRGVVIVAQRHVLELLFFLIRHRGRLVSKGELVQGPWHGLVVGDAALNRAVMLARRALVDDSLTGANALITTVRGKGFRFDAEVTQIAEGAAVASDGWGFVGRGAELGRLAEHFERACDGNPGLVLVHGEPGIGKTKLLEQFARVGTARGATVAWGRCQEGLGAPAFWPWLEIVRSLSRAEGEGLGAAAASGAEELLRLLEAGAASAESQSPADAQAARFRTFDLLARFLTRASESKPVLALLDDLHEADASSLGVLEFLRRSAASSRLLIVGASRTCAVAERLAVDSSLELCGLSSAEVAVLLATLEKQGVPATLADAVQRATDGHPLLVLELSRSGALAEFSDTRGASALSARIPARIGDFIRARLSLLPEATRAALGVAAVFGREFCWPLVCGVLALPTDAGLAPLEPALLSGLVEAAGLGPGQYRFAHGSYRELVYQDLRPAARAELHARAGACLEASSDAPNLNALARQFAAACVASGAHLEKAKRYLLLAAAHARKLHAHEQALEHYSSCLRLLDPNLPKDSGERGLVLLLVAEVEAVLGEPTRAREALERALESARTGEDAKLLAEAVLGLAALSRELCVPDPKLGALLREALAKTPPRSGLQARLLAAQSALGVAEQPGRGQATACAGALALARELGESRALLAVLQVVHPQLLGPARIHEASRRAREMRRLAEEHEDPLALMEARLWQARHLFELGRGDDFAFEAAEHAELARDTRHQGQQWFARALSATRSYQRGQIEEARCALQGALAFGSSPQRPRVQAMFGVHLLNVALELCGKERRAALEEVRTIVEAVAARDAELTSLRFLRPLVRLQLGDATGARALLQLSAEEVLALPEDGELLPSLVSLIDLFTAFKDQRGLRAAFERLRPYAGLHVCAALSDWGPVSFHLGRAAQALEEEASSRASFEQALLDTQGTGSRPWLSWTRYRYARTLAQSPHRADRTEAVSLVALAQDDARRYHMPALAEATRSTKALPSPRVLLKVEPPFAPDARTSSRDEPS